MTVDYMKQPWGIFDNDEATARIRIMELWDQGLDSYAIRWRIHMPEFRIAQVISEYVTSKKSRGA
jgi:hypothetical protein